MLPSILITEFWCNGRDFSSSNVRSLVFLTFISSLSKHTRESCLDYRQQLTNLVGQNSLQSTENADAPLLVGAPIFLDSV